MNRRAFLALAAAGATWAWYVDRGQGAAPSRGQAASVVAAAIGYARRQAGKPYQWGGTGPAAFDCSGLTYMAYAAAGITIPRTAASQWDAGPQVDAPAPGDLVFFPGADGTWAQPGHVGLVTGAHAMIQAYAPGVPIGTYPFGMAAALGGTGPGDVIGYTRPWAAS